MGDNIKILRKLAQKGAEEYYGTPIPQEVNDRLEYEFGLLTPVMADMMLDARQNFSYLQKMGYVLSRGISSIVMFCIGASNTDPIKFGLLSENFDWGAERLLYVYRPIEGTPNVDLRKLPLDNEAVFDILKRGETDKVYIPDNDVVNPRLRDFQPNNFSELSIFFALLKPGLEARLKTTRQQPDTFAGSDLPEVKSILKDTFGVRVYQEQDMQIAQAIGGFSREESADFRRAILKNNEEKLSEYKMMFFQRASVAGYDAESIAGIWNEWESSGRRPVSKSYITDLALITYAKVWQRVHEQEKQ